MIFENATDLSDGFLRGMLRWCCKQVGWDQTRLTRVAFGNRNTRACSGRAWPSSCRILVRANPANRYPILMNNSSVQCHVPDRIALLVFITAHELQHLVNWHSRLPCGTRLHYALTKARDLEPHCNRVASRVTQDFERSRLSLSYSWHD